MKKPHDVRRMMARRRARAKWLALVIVLAVIGALVGALVTRAEAAETCTHVPPTVTLDLTASGDDATLSVDSTTGQILADGVPCGTADTTNTALIDVNGSDEGQRLRIHLGGGPFSNAGVEIGFDVNLGAGSDSLWVYGSDGADSIRLGTDGINLNGDDDSDVTLAGIEAFRVDGRGGDDVLTAIGGFGTGSIFSAAAVTILGGDGEDAIAGGTRNDRLEGGNDADRLYGNAGNDRLLGGASADRLVAGTGDDLLAGESGSDVAEGGPGHDKIYGGGGGDRLVGEAGVDGLYGESGNDRLYGGYHHDGLNGGTGSDYLRGQAGNDVLVGGGSRDRLWGDSGSDTLYGRGDRKADQLYGGSGTDYGSWDPYDTRSSLLSLSARTRKIFEDFGAWVDLFDYGLDPAAATSRMRSNGVRTLYLQTGRYTSSGAFGDPGGAGRWLEAAHNNGISVFGWYLPGYANLSRDAGRTVAIRSFRSPRGDRFDGLAVDIEERKEVDYDNDRFNSGIVSHLRRVRNAVGSTYPIGAITFPSRDMTLAPNSWAGYPWTRIGQYSDAVLPMAYWTARVNQCDGGANPEWCTYQYIRANIAEARRLTGLPVHVIGGVGSHNSMTTGQVAAFVRAARSMRAHGGSFYDYRTTKSGWWSELRKLNLL